MIKTITFIYDDDFFNKMDNDELLDKIGIFLYDYLEKGLLGRPSYSGEIEDVLLSEAMDISKARFSEIYDVLPEATLADFISVVSQVERPVVLDLRTMFGEQFGLWVAKNNPSSEVHVYSASTPAFFANFLFNALNLDWICKLEKIIPFDGKNIEDSVNALYRANNLENIEFHEIYATNDIIQKYLDANVDRDVFIFSDRSQELTAAVAGMISKSQTGNMIMMPFLKTDIGYYADDEIMGLINKHYHQLRNPLNHFSADGDRRKIIDPSLTNRTRLFTAMHEYFALKCGIEAGGNVYRESKPRNGFPLDIPQFYVSTVEPAKR